MNRISLVVPLLLVLSAGCVPPAKSRPPKAEGPTASLRDRVRAESRAHLIACELADRVGPRLAGSEGDRKAVEWALAKMKEIGLANVRAEPVTVPYWERIREEAAVVSPVAQPLSLAALGASVSTPAGGLEAEVVRVDSLEALAALEDAQVKGKIVFFDKPMARRAPDGWSAYGDAVDVRSRGAHAAAGKGAVASLIRSIGTGNARFPHTGAQRTHGPEGAPKIPAAALAIPDAEMLSRLLADGPVRLRLVIETKDHGETQSANVVGEVVGREKPDEIVLIGAHLDSWDLGTGAVDDAAGVGAALEIARFLRANPPRRTVRVVLFANEENGLKGAFAYAAAHAAALPKHQGAIEMDAGDGKALRFAWNGAPSIGPAVASIGPLLAPLGIEGPEHSEHAGGADLIPLGPAGVPRFGLMQDATRYFDVHHTANDTCDKIVPHDLSQATAAAAVVVRELAEMPAFLERTPPPPDDPATKP